MTDEKAEAPVAAQPEKVKWKHKRRWLMVSLLALFLALMTAVVIYYPQLDKLYQQQPALEVATPPAPSYASVAQLQQLRQQLRQLRQIVSQVAKQQANTPAIKAVPTHDSDWVLADVVYLTHLAVYSLQVNQATATAIALLQTADRQLASLSNPQFISLRTSLATAMTQLQAVPRVDREGLIAKFAALSQQVKQLPMHRPTITQNTPATNENGWQHTWEQLKKVVLIQRNDGGMPIYLDHVQQASLQLQIMQLLSQAQWAVLHQETKVYQTTLMQIRTLLQQYYRQTDTGVQAMLDSLHTLQQTTIAPSLPTLQPLLSELQAVQQGRKSA